MAGKTGKRARPPQKCWRCGKPIEGNMFERSRKGDSHLMSPDGSYWCFEKLPNNRYVEAIDGNIRNLAPGNLRIVTRTNEKP